MSNERKDDLDSTKCYTCPKESPPRPFDNKWQMIPKRIEGSKKYVWRCPACYHLQIKRLHEDTTGRTPGSLSSRRYKNGKIWKYQD